VLLRVLRLREGGEVFRRVVRAITIDVVHIFVRLQEATGRLFPYQAVLKHVPVLTGKVVPGHVQRDIALAVGMSSTTPGRRVFHPFATALVPVDVAHLVPSNDGGQGAATTGAGEWIRAMLGMIGLRCLVRYSQMMARNVFRVPIFVLRILWDRLATATGTGSRGWGLLGDSLFECLNLRPQVVKLDEPRRSVFMLGMIGNFLTTTALAKLAHAPPPPFLLYQVQERVNYG
jgi:hypothetical protein